MHVHDGAGNCLGNKDKKLLSIFKFKRKNAAFQEIVQEKCKTACWHVPRVVKTELCEK